MDANTDAYGFLTLNSPNLTDHTSVNPAVPFLPHPSPETDMNADLVASGHAEVSAPGATGSNSTVQPQSSTSTASNSNPSAVPSPETPRLANPDATSWTDHQDFHGDEEVSTSDSEDSVRAGGSTEQRELIMVEGYKSDANMEFNGTAAMWGQICEHDGSHFRPRDPHKRWDSVSLKVRVVGGRVAPHLSLHAIVEDEARRSTVHEGRLDFYSGSVHGTRAQIINLKLSREASGRVTKNGDFDGSFVCKFDTHGGVPSFLWLPEKNKYDSDTLATFQLLQGLTHHTLADVDAKPVQVVLRISAKVQTHDKNEALWEALNGLTTNSMQPWHQYMRPSGLPQCQFGGMIKRSIIVQDIPLIEYPAQNFFIDVKEAEVKLAYCAAVEYDWKQVMLESLESETHSVSFVHVGGRMILARVKLSGAYTIHGDRITIDPGTYLTLSWKATGHDKRQHAVGVTIENWLGFTDTDLIMLIHKHPASFLDVNPVMAGALDTERPPGPFPLNLKAVANEADVKRQISAMHTLCDTTNPDHERWWPLLLNQDIRRLQPQTVAQMEGVDADVMKKACETADSLLPWNPEQKKVWCDGGKFYGGACLFEGPPGTGKTKVLAALALIYLLCGFHVLLVAPTGAASDNEVTDLVAFIHRSGTFERFNPIRIYRPLAELRGLLARPEVDQDDLSADNPDVQLLELLVTLKKDLDRRNFNLQDISLQARTIQRAREQRKEDTLMTSYPPDPDSPPTGTLEELSKVNMWEEFRRHLDLIKETPLHEWTPEERRKFRYSWKCCRNLVVEEARCVITTDSNAACQFVRNHFGGESTKGIFILQDEAANESESRTWIPMVKLKNAAHVKGLVMVGDNKQLPPCFLTKNTKRNEFVEQGLKPLYTRLLAEGSPSVRLKVQYRMHPLISAFPNQRVYGGKLIDADVTRTRPRDTNSDNLISSFLGGLDGTESKFDPILACVDVEDGVCQTDTNSPSKLNVMNINVVMSLLISRLNGSKGKALRNITVVVPYRAQKALYVQRILLASKALKVQPASLAKVVTIDGFQGKEDDIIILDTVVTDQLGFLQEQDRMNVACTRAKDNLIIVAKVTITVEARFKEWKEDKGTDTGIRVANPKPFLIGYLEYMQSRNLVFTRKGADHRHSSFEPEASGLPLQPGRDEWTGDNNTEEGGDTNQESKHPESTASEAEIEGEPDWGKSGPGVQDSSHFDGQTGKNIGW